VAHSPDHYEGKILRIDPRTPGVAPADNPFAEAPYATTEPRNVVWATGLRNPFRFIVDPVTSKVIAADVGTDVYEELNIVEPGKDYGYPEIEGPGSEGGAIEPMLWYRHEAPPGESDENKVCTSIIGTTFVDGAIVGAPDERAIAYADFGCGRVWVATVDLDAGTVGEVFEIGQVSYSTSAVVSHPDGGIVALAAGPGDQQTLKFQPA
jgi:glucose/arabinose dehydrogenase